MKYSEEYVALLKKQSKQCTDLIFELLNTPSENIHELMGKIVYSSLLLKMHIDLLERIERDLKWSKGEEGEPK